MQTQLQTKTLYVPPTVNQAEKKQKEYDINPSLVRFVFIPLQSLIDQPTNAFYVNELPANTFFPMYAFDFPVPSSTEDKNLSKERTPGEQIEHLGIAMASRQYHRQYVDFTEIALLDDLDLADKIFKALSNETQCPKYGFELKNQCLTCWLDYLNNDADNVIEATFATNLAVQKVAKISKGKLTQAIYNALNTADEAVADALRDLDEKTTGKTSLAPIDFLNIFHTHKDRPKFRTTTDNQRDLHDVLQGLNNTLNRQNPSTTDSDAVIKQVASMLAEQKADADAREARLLAEINELRAQATPTSGVVEVSYGKGDAVTFDGREAVVVGKPFGKVTIKFPDGEEKTVNKEEIGVAK